MRVYFSSLVKKGVIVKYYLIQGIVIGKTQTTSYGDKYGGFKKKEIYDNFGNKQGEIDTHKW